MPQVETTDPAKSAQNTALFMECVSSYAQQAMMAMGKIVNPFTKKAERNLDVARLFIDMLEMLEAKTKGNLGKDEERFLQTSLSSLRLTYVEEAGRPEQPAEGPKPEAQNEGEVKPEQPKDEAKASEAPADEESKKRFTKKYD